MMNHKYEFLHTGLIDTIGEIDETIGFIIQEQKIKIPWEIMLRCSNTVAKFNDLGNKTVDELDKDLMEGREALEELKGLLK